MRCLYARLYLRYEMHSATFLTLSQTFASHARTHPDDSCALLHNPYPRVDYKKTSTDSTVSTDFHVLHSKTV